MQWRISQLTTRKQRTEAFSTFSDQSNALFNSYWATISDEKDLKQLNDLVICPKGAMGGLNDNLIEVFFGMKYHSWYKHVGDNFNVTDKANVIYGARLEYRLTDNGNVYVILTPSKTDNFKPLEDGIILDIVKEPNKLINKASRHWAYLISYMKVTDVDGQPNIVDSIVVAYLRSTRRYFESGKSQTRKIQNWLSFVAKWVVSVGLSGLIIFLIIVYMNEKKEDKDLKKLINITEQLVEGNLKKDKLITQMGLINSRLTEIDTKQIKLLDQQLSSEDLNSSLRSLSQTINESDYRRYNEIIEKINQLTIDKSVTE